MSRMTNLIMALIGTGLTLMILHWRLRRLYRSWNQADNPWSRFIIRF